MDLWVNPTGHRVRSDSEGDGRFGARRKTRKHKGLDLLCIPGQEVLSPTELRLVRLAFPYEDSRDLEGCLLRSSSLFQVKIFYVRVFPELIGAWLEKGQPFGIAQDVRERYGPAMLPHIHLEIRRGKSLTDPYPFIFGETVQKLNK